MKRRTIALIVLFAILAGAQIFSGGKHLQTVPEGSDIGGPFALTAADGKTYTDKSFPGKYLLIYFGFTHCPDVCPTTLGTMMGSLKHTSKKDAGKVQPLFISVDPGRDTPAVVGAYASSFTSPDVPNLIGLAGTPDEIATVTKEYRVYAEKHATGSGPDDYVMDHSSVLCLIAPDGHFVAALNPDQSAGALAGEIEKHLK